jgi:hypothetical protein
MSRFRIIITSIALAIVVSLAIKLIMLAHAEPIFKGRPLAVSRSVPSTDAEVDRLFRHTPHVGMYETLDRYFPEDSAMLRKKTLEILQLGFGKDQIAVQLVPVVIKVRRKNARHAYFASDATLKKVLDLQIKLYEAFKTDIPTCNRIIVYGSARSASQQFEPFTSMLFEAMYEGKTTPHPREEASEALRVLLANELEQVLTQEDMATLAKMDVENPRTCNAMITFFSTVKNASFDGADSFRANAVRTLLAN